MWVKGFVQLAACFGIAALLFLFCSLATHAATFGCTIRQNSTCLSNETLLLRLNTSEAANSPNNSHAQLANYSGALYNWSVCCWTDSFRTLTNSCGGTATAVLSLFNATDSHVGYWPSAYSAWNYRKEVVIDAAQVNGTLENFPFLVNIAVDSDIAAHALANGNDIVFVNTSGAKLSHEIEYYNSSSGALLAWVRIPILSNTTNTVLFLYYGNSGSSNQQDKTAVWDANYTFVWHLSNGTVLNTNDSTNKFNGTINNPTNVSAVSGMIDGGARLIPNGNIATSDNVIDPSLTDVTFSVWMKAPDSSLSGNILSQNPLNGTGRSWLYFLGGDSTLYTKIGGVQTSTGIIVANNTWNLVTWIKNGTTVRVYMNGTLASTVTVSPTESNVGYLRLGVNNGGQGGFNGTLDEARLSNSSRSGQWIRTEYLNQRSGSTMASISAEEPKYAYDACFGVSAGAISCVYQNNSCSAGYASVVSIASSEQLNANYSNAHVADPNYFDMKVCCQVGAQNPPNIAYVNISPNVIATSAQDLECQNGTTIDADGDTVTLAYNWYLNGTSITLLNLPMAYNGSRMIDISGYGNHASLGAGVTPVASGGYLGVGASFNGVNANLNAGTGSSLANLRNFTYNAWIYPISSQTASAKPIFYKGGGTSMKQLYFSSGIGTPLRLFGNVLTNATGATASSTDNAITLNTWQMVTMIYDDSGDRKIRLYVNGAEVNYTDQTAATGTTLDDSATAQLIGQTQTNRLNGSMDEALIFNRSLTAAEIKTLYNSNNRFLNASELRRGNQWNCSIVAIDSTWINSTQVYSNRTTIIGSAPFAPNLTYPRNNNQTVFERFINFSWNISDERDGDQVNYTLNLTLTPGTCSVATTQSNLQTLNYTFGELCVDQMYNWTVQACDVDGCSSTSTRFNFTIASVVGVRLTTNLTQLGQFGRNQTKATDADGIAPFILNNTGNVRINITLNGTNNPFSSDPRPTTNYMYKAGINTTSAFNESGSQLLYTPVDSVYKNLISQLNYSTSAAGNSFIINSTARIDMNITAPINEPAGQKQGNITVQAVAG